MGKSCERCTLLLIASCNSWKRQQEPVRIMEMDSLHSSSPSPPPMFMDVTPVSTPSDGTVDPRLLSNPIAQRVVLPGTDHPSPFRSPGIFHGYKSSNSSTETICGSPPPLAPVDGPEAPDTSSVCQIHLLDMSFAHIFFL
jgi:hypothetical protein